MPRGMPCEAAPRLRRASLVNGRHLSGAAGAASELALLLLSSCARPEGCLTPPAEDVLARYYAAVLAGDSAALKATFSDKGYAHGHVENGRYTNLTPAQYADQSLPKLHAMGLVEEETCRIAEERHGDFTVVTGHYAYSLSNEPAKKISGVRVVTIDRASNTITSMNDSVSR
jgi:hypothetical protein